ncbi:hypothetical protein COO60DRAFT_1202116 [Scenedesmus sp. NREL 46B-D3]|nr:hypothetical protein COO60DRAFT_1202116 [Scenedesmus sp. NREL 46B-D3]
MWWCCCCRCACCLAAMDHCRGPSWLRWLPWSKSKPWAETEACEERYVEVRTLRSQLLAPLPGAAHNMLCSLGCSGSSQVSHHSCHCCCCCCRCCRRAWQQMPRVALTMPRASAHWWWQSQQGWRMRFMRRDSSKPRGEVDACVCLRAGGVDAIA